MFKSIFQPMFNKIMLGLNGSGQTPGNNTQVNSFIQNGKLISSGKLINNAKLWG